MKTLINKTRAPLKIGLPGGKTVRLGPGKAGQIRDEDADGDAIKKLVEAGDLEVHQGEVSTGSGSGPGGVHKAGGHGQGKATFRQRKGDR
jgi:hypothetical protein